jgi:hypothetical protein
VNYLELYQAIQNYAENTEQLFVQNIPMFIKEAEDRIYNSVQIPALRKNVTGTLTTSNPYVALPNDWLANYSFAVIDSLGNYNFLIDKDVNFIREAYPNASTLSAPKYYSLFGSQYSDVNEMTLMVGPTPDKDYSVEMHYFYYPPTIVQGEIATLSGTFSQGSSYTSGVYYNVSLTGGNGSNATATIQIVNGSVTSVTIDSGGSLYTAGDSLTFSASGIGNGTGSGFLITVATVSNATGKSWIGDNYDPVLFYGAMREAIVFMKGEQDMVTYYEQKYQEALSQLKRLGDGLDRNDAYRRPQTSLPYSKL